MAGTTPLGPRSEPKSAGFPTMPAPSGGTVPRTPRSTTPVAPPVAPPVATPPARVPAPPAATPPATPPAAPAPPRAHAPRFSLAWKIFLGAGAVVTLVLGLTLVLTNISAKRAADVAIDRNLVLTAQRVEGYLAGRQRAMLNGARAFVQPSPFYSLFASDSIQREDILDQAIQAAQLSGATWVQMTDGQGVRLAKSDDPAAPADTLAGSALIGRALEGEETSGVGLTGDSLIYQVVAAPVRAAENVVGVMMVARMIDSVLADSIKRETQSEIVFYALDTLDRPHVAVSTLPRTPELDRALRDRVAMRAAPAAPGAAPDSAAPPADSAALPRAEFDLGGTHYIGQGALLRSASGTPLGGFVALRSRDQELASFRRLRDTILLAGALGLGLAFLLSYLIASQITKPVASLVAATRRAAEGDYSADITVRASDEIGTLADAFRAMLADLRDKQALVDFLSAGDTQQTVPIAKLSGTMQHAAEAMGAMGAGIVPGETFAGRYDVKEVLGVGGMGMVFKAHDRELDETVAIKTLKPDYVGRDSTALERFKSEIRLARKISHRNVVRTHDLGESAGVYYITMEFVEGKSLKDLIKARGRLPVPATLTIGKQLCRALEVAHEQGVIHRDIKPQNLVVEADGVLKVMDFGIARLAQRKSGVTEAGMVIGTPEYMAPEQLMGDEIDARADLWSAGVVLYECLTGSLPFNADSPIVLVTRVLEETPPKPRLIVPEVPRELSDLVMRVLSKDRDQRPRTADELHDLLAAIG